MIAVFFAKLCHVTSVPLQERKTVNAEWYINTCLQEVLKAWSARSTMKTQVPTTPTPLWTT